MSIFYGARPFIKGINICVKNAKGKGPPYMLIIYMDMHSIRFIDLRFGMVLHYGKRAFGPSDTVAFLEYESLRQLLVRNGLA